MYLKKILTVLFSFAVCWSILAFVESAEVGCSIPDKHLLRIIDCVLDQSPASIQKFSDIIYQCIDEYYENNGKSHSILLAMCNNDVQDDEDVTNCLEEKFPKLTPPTADELDEFKNRAEYCMFYAK